MGSRIQTWRPKTFHINRTTGAGRTWRPINTFISSISSTLSLFLIMQLVKGISSVTSPRICCGLWSWQRSHSWIEAKASPRFWWVWDPTGGTVEEWRAGRTVCLALWKCVLQRGCSPLRHPDLQDSLIQACFSISYELPITPPQIQQSWCLLLIRFSHRCWQPKSLNFTVYRVECFSGLEGPLWFAAQGGS